MRSHSGSTVPFLLCCAGAFLLLWPLTVHCGSNQIRLGEYADSDELWRRVTCLVNDFEGTVDGEKQRSGVRNGSEVAPLQRSFDRCFAEDLLVQSPEAGGHTMSTGNVSLHLMCRSDDSMTVIVDRRAITGSSVFYLTRVDPGSIYFLSLYNKTTLSQLHPETTYEIISYLLIKEKTMKVIKSKELETRTLAKGYTPGGIATAVASPVRLNKHKLLNVDIIWSPVKDFVCSYAIVGHSRNRPGGLIHEGLQVELGNDRPQRLTHELRNLAFNSQYHVMVYAFNAKDPRKEGLMTNVTFDTPSAGTFNISGMSDPHNDFPHHHSNHPIFIEKSVGTSIGLIVGIVLLGVLIGLVILQWKRIAGYYRDRGRMFQNSGEDPIELETFNTTDLTIYLDNETEIGMDSLRISNVIGQGAFGMVRKAVITIGDKEELVAVKMLRKNANKDDLREFIHEIDVMKSVGKHPNIVGLVGHSNTNSLQMMLLIEYCEKGNLLNFLRDEWRRLSNTSVNNGAMGNSVENRCYVEIGVLTNRDLLSMACQIGQGMEYLSKNKVVHRDLAARNILVCEGNVVKISDFGLSRDVYQYNMYTKRGSGKLPIKWLAIESLTHQVYTSQSDVWSYGILLYEILTLGSDPYPSIPTNEMLPLLNTGYRMERPRNCPEEIYDTMLDCWKTTPAERPSFKLINERFAELLRGMTDEEAVIKLGTVDETYPSYMMPI